VVETGSVSRAAERVFRTAPAVSIALRKLEEEIGAPLFDRSERNNHRLTGTGRLLYSYASRILELRREASESIKSLNQTASGNLRLGTHESTSLYLLPSLVQAFSQDQPEAKIEVVCGNSERLLKALDDRTTELALIADAPEDAKFERQLILRDELALILGPKHRLAGADLIQVRDLANEFLIVQGPKSMLRERIVKAFRESETPFKVGVENIAIEAIKRMVAQGLGIGFVPLMCVREELAQGKLATVPLDGVSKDWDLWLVWRKDYSLSSAAKAFVDVSISRFPLVEDEPEHGRERKSERSSKSRQPFAMRPRKPIHC
ncbi:MAG: LysR family transcriptional regulator, partial [Pyrinomonadaceae bacterium]